MAKIIALLIVFFSLHAEIIEINRMEAILPYVDETSWVLFDIDDTVLESELQVGRAKWFFYEVEKQLIKVEDDGCGMSPEDALLSLERHATSKIRCAEDLQALTTMGFRGEALAAISAVSQFEMKTSNGVAATRILIEGGKNAQVEPCARNQGTTMEVRSLFYNVPARKKFQKSQNASMASITRTVEILAIAHPEVAFSLNGREFAKSTYKIRLKEILEEYEHEVEGKGIFGYVAAPAKAMATRIGQYVYINKRPIFSPLIAKAVKEAFGMRIKEHTYPRFVLFLEISPEEIDVNVHPQKREVRFRDEGAIFRSVRNAVEKAFLSQVMFSEPISFSTLQQPVSFSEHFPTFECKVEKEQEFDWIFPERPLAVVGKMFLLQREQLILVDLQAAHARLLFEKLQYEKGGAQTLLWPLEIPLANGEEERAETLNELGIECRILKKRLVIDALPPFLDAADFPQFYAEWKGGKKLSEIATRFCRSLQKTLSLEQAIGLWREVQKCKDRIYDPLGHPISTEIGEEDLVRMLSCHG